MKIKLNNLYNANKIKINSDVSEIDEILEYEQILLEISKAIVSYREKHNLTQNELAEKIGVNQAMISKLESGSYNPTIKALYNISRKLTKSSYFFIDILKDIIKSLYKDNSIKVQIKMYEEFGEYNKKDNITYILNFDNEKEKSKKINYDFTTDNNEYGGMVYDEISSTGRVSTIG